MGKDINEIMFDDRVLNIRVMEERMTRGGVGCLGKGHQ